MSHKLCANEYGLKFELKGLLKLTKQSVTLGLVKSDFGLDCSVVLYWFCYYPAYYCFWSTLYFRETTNEGRPGVNVCNFQPFAI